MSDRYFARVVHVQDKYTAILNAGSERGVATGMKFLLVGLGDLIVDPDTNEELGRLEIIRGRAEVVHVQPKLATLRSIELERQRDTREIKKVTSRSTGINAFLGPQDVVTESIRPAEPRLLELRALEIGDLAIKL